MNVVVKLLPETWFSALPISMCAEAKKRIPLDAQASQWRCVVDTRQSVLITNLVSSSGEMRDGDYYYLLAIRKNLFIVIWRSGKAEIVCRCPDPQDSEPINENAVLVIAAETMIVLDVANRTPYRTIVDSRGRPLAGKP